MRIFVFEFITGGGWFAIDPQTGPSGSLLAEGRAMAEAVIADFLALKSTEVATLLDRRLALAHQPECAVTAVQEETQLWDALAFASQQADFTLLIAPEFDGLLLRAAELVESVGSKLLSSASEFIRTTGDKHATAEYLAARNVPAPRGALVRGNAFPQDNAQYPAVIKPNDGAGSIGVTLLPNSQPAADQATSDSFFRWETYHPGQQVSVAAICGPKGISLLPPCQQRISSDGRFTYLGGSCPIEDDLAKRATKLGERAINALPRATGYVGIDLILCEDPSGNEDLVIEVNPRLTTSYVGLRRMVRENLAQAMLALEQGESITLSTRPGRVEFSASGDVQYHEE